MRCHSPEIDIAGGGDGGAEEVVGLALYII